MPTPEERDMPAPVAPPNMSETMDQIQEAKDRHQIEEWFTYHAPTPDEIARMGELREKAKEYALLIQKLVPRCADRTVALRTLQLASMQANMAIVCNRS